MALGSDAGVFPHGDNARELLEYVRLGLTPGEALATATINAAAVLRLSADRGRLEPGMRADFIAVRGNPLQDIQALLQVDTVVRNGRVAVSGSAGAQP
jgi:imidazolonepropionase-like amidohydrolase